MLTIFRGNDLAFAEVDRKVCVQFNTFLDLTGWTAKFYLLDTVKSCDDISSRLWTFGYTADETQNFPLGKTFGKLVVLDQSEQIRQMAKVEVDIVNKKFDPCIAGTIAISVDNVIADYNKIANKPILNGKVIEGDHTSKYYSLVPIEDFNSLVKRVDEIDPETTINSLVHGLIPITRLLFEAEGDNDNYYRLQVVMRDDGAGNMLPALALDAVPRD